MQITATGSKDKSLYPLLRISIVKKTVQFKNLFYTVSYIVLNQRMLLCFISRWGAMVLATHTPSIDVLILLPFTPVFSSLLNYVGGITHPINGFKLMQFIFYSLIKCLTVY